MWVSFKWVNTQNLQHSAEGATQFEFLVHYGQEQICRHRDPDLRFTALGRVPNECFKRRLPLIHLKNNSMSQRFL
jgi:hypothetical protein